MKRSNQSGIVRELFEEYIVTRPLVTKYKAKLHKSSCGNHYKDLRVNTQWHTFNKAFRIGYEKGLHGFPWEVDDIEKGE